jgi:hypothetical protein
MMGNYHTELTDAHGRWSCSHVPPKFGMIDYSLVHPDYQETRYASDSPDSALHVSVERPLKQISGQSSDPARSAD